VRAGTLLMSCWLFHPASPEHGTVARASDYHTAANLIFEVDVLTRGPLVQAQDDFVQGASNGTARRMSGACSRTARY
jgi:hypothetical protein